ncbi:hypothetical protein [Micromonospora viridifaciens]|uniref:hypothetical protein n=1 Tax=Micromonospora viridifaciens TaxID=1881 RepID=UPI0018D52BDE|nr:hypothetical protein [Micromonospora viridifaciens]
MIATMATTRHGETLMEATDHRELAREALDGRLGGNAASIRATARALAKVESAVAVVLVEGISDQIALERPQRAAGGISRRSGS